MASIFDVAEWFLQKEPMTHKKLQKLCYYSQAWSYALRNAPIIDDSDFEAWIHGPVSRVLFDKYTGRGWEDIRPENRVLSFSPVETDLLESVWMTYGEMSANALEVQSHTELPWIIARGTTPPGGRCSNIVEPAEMRKFYLSIYEGDDERCNSENL